MTRKFGIASHKIGTGKVDPNALASEKWAGSAAAQVETASKIKVIAVKTIPVDYVVSDSENPRKLSLTQSQICKIAKKFPLDKSKLQIEDQSEWMEAYLKQVQHEEKLERKAIQDLESLLNFASSLKSAERMLHPIVVWQAENTFHLIAGERRLLTHILLNESNIAARIVANTYSRTEIAVLQWEENVQRQDMTLSEKLELVKKLIETGEGVDKTSVTRLSKILGRSRSESQRYLVVLRYPSPFLLEKIQEGKITDLKIAAALAQLPLEHLKARFSDLKSKAPPKFAIKIVNRKQAPHFGKILQAAAHYLNMTHFTNDVDLKNSESIMKTANLMMAEIEARTHE
jgi:ParB/RepB/Spo0J family partition protein